MCKLESSSENASEDNKCSKMVRRMQYWLVFLCAIVFVGTFVIYGIKVKHCTVHYTLDYIISTDSTGFITPESKALADSIMHEMQKQQKLLEDKYQYFIEQQSNTQDILTMGGVLLSIIVSLVGFFGYRTIQSIEGKTKKIGEDAAKDAFKKQLKDLQSKHYKELLSEQFVPELNSRIEAGLSKYEGDNSRLINDHEKRLNLVEGTVSDIRARIKNHGIILGESATDGSKFEKTGLEINPFD